MAVSKKSRRQLVTYGARSRLVPVTRVHLSQAIRQRRRPLRTVRIVLRAADHEQVAMFSLWRRVKRNRIALSLHTVSAFQTRTSYACQTRAAVTPAPRNVLLEDALGRKMADGDERHASGKVVILNLDSSPGRRVRGVRRLPLRDASWKRLSQL